MSSVQQDDRGWNKTQLSGAAALQQMESAILGPFLGWIMDRFGPQGLVRLGRGGVRRGLHCCR